MPTAKAPGIIIIHQELALVPLLSIAENIFLGHEPAKRGVIDWYEAYARTAALLKKVGLREHPNTLVTNIGAGKQQLVEIAKALNKQVKLLILDEPTSSLNETDSNALLALLTEFKAHGISSILITHKLNEVLKVADRITILRDGKTIDTLDTHTAKVSEDRIITAMVGREMSDRYPQRHAKIGDAGLRGARLARLPSASCRSRNDQGRRHDGAQRRGGRHRRADGRRPHRIRHEPVRRAPGARRSAAKPAFTASRPTSVRYRRPRRPGLAYVTEDRKTYGLVLIDDVKHNVTLANLEGVSRHAVIDDLKELGVANRYRSDLSIRCPSVFQSRGQLVRRQPAEGRARQVAVRGAGRADPR